MENFEDCQQQKLSCMMLVSSFEKFLESKRHSKDKVVKITFKFHHLDHYFIEGEVATKVGDCISNETNNFSWFPRFVA